MLTIPKRYHVLIARTLRAQDASFENLVRMADLDPQEDFQFRDLSYLHFGRADLRGFCFRGTNLDYSNLESCIIDDTTNFSEASTVETLFPSSYLKRSVIHGKLYSVLFVEFDVFFLDHFKKRLGRPSFKFETHRSTSDEYSAALGVLFSRLSNRKDPSALICVDRSIYNVMGLEQKIPPKLDGKNMPEFFYIWLNRKAKDGLVKGFGELNSSSRIAKEDRQALDTIKTAIEITQRELGQL